MTLKSRTNAFYSLLSLLIAPVILSGCLDKDSTIGAPYFNDKVDFRTVSRQDTTFLHMTPTNRPAIEVNNHFYAATWASPVALIGKVNMASENVESWGVFRFPILTADTIKRIVAMRLLLKTVRYKYGDTASNHIDLQVFGEDRGKTGDSTTSLLRSDLAQPTIGSIQADVVDTGVTNVNIPIDTSIKFKLPATSFTFVVTPGPTMTNVRGFGTSDNSSAQPQLEYTILSDSGTTSIITRTPILDYHVVNDLSVDAPHEFVLRGSTARREAIGLSLNLPGDTVQLDQFSTINSASLVLVLDPANSRTSNLSVDTSGPSIVQITATGENRDTGTVFVGLGTRDGQDPNTYHFELRYLLERWLRNPTTNLGLELRSGYAVRAFPAGLAGVEDNTLNRWSFYDRTAVDPAKRPRFIVTYSKLK